MSGYSNKPSSHSADIISFPDAYRLIWATGDMALAQQSRKGREAIRGHVADIVGELFERLEVIKIESEKLGGPLGETPQISVDTLTEEVRAEIVGIHAGVESFRQTGQINPFTIRDNRLEALYAVKLGVGAARHAQLNPYEEG